jgi:hypothetical protein
MSLVPPSGSEVAVYPRRERVLLAGMLPLFFVLLGFVFLIPGVLMLVFRDSPSTLGGLFLAALGVALIVGYGKPLRLCLARAVFGRPFMVVRNDGFLISEDGIAEPRILIPWGEISCAYPYHQDGVDYWGVDLRDEEFLVSRLPKGRLKHYFKCRRKGTPMVTVPRAVLPGGCERLFHDLWRASL